MPKLPDMISAEAFKRYGMSAVAAAAMLTMVWLMREQIKDARAIRNELGAQLEQGRVEMAKLTVEIVRLEKDIDFQSRLIDSTCTPRRERHNRNTSTATSTVDRSITP